MTNDTNDLIAMPFGAKLHLPTLGERSMLTSERAVEVATTAGDVCSASEAVEAVCDALASAVGSHGGLPRDGVLTMGGLQTRMIAVPVGGVDQLSWGSLARFHWAHLMRTFAAITESPYLVSVVTSSGTVSSGPAQDDALQRSEDARAGLLSDVGVSVRVTGYSQSETVSTFGRMELVDPTDERSRLRIVFVRHDRDDSLLLAPGLVRPPGGGEYDHEGEPVMLHYDYAREVTYLLASMRSLPTTYRMMPYTEMAADLGIPPSAAGLTLARDMVRLTAQAIERGKLDPAEEFGESSRDVLFSILGEGE